MIKGKHVLLLVAGALLFHFSTTFSTTSTCDKSLVNTHVP